MGRKLGLTLDHVIAAAAEIADRDGLDSLTLASLASTLGVKSPSLYNHVAGLDGLRRQLTLSAASQLSDELADSVAGKDPIEALRSAAIRLRRFAHRHPGLYDSLLPAPSPEQDPELAEALGESVQIIGSVLTDLDVDQTAIIPFVRALRAVVHGFVDIELRGGFGLPEDLDDSFAVAVDLVVDAITADSNRRRAS